MLVDWELMAAGSVRNVGCARRNAANGADAAVDGSFSSHNKKKKTKLPLRASTCGAALALFHAGTCALAASLFFPEAKVHLNWRISDELDKLLDDLIRLK